MAKTSHGIPRSAVAELFRRIAVLILALQAALVLVLQPFDHAQAETMIASCPDQPLVTNQGTIIVDPHNQTCSYSPENIDSATGDKLYVGLSDYPDGYGYWVPIFANNTTATSYDYEAFDDFGDYELTGSSVELASDGWERQVTVTIYEVATGDQIAEFIVEYSIESYDDGNLRLEISIPNGVTFYKTAETPDTTDTVDTIAPEVTSVEFQNSSGTLVDSVAPGTDFKVVVTFNEPMDTSLEPTIAYFDEADGVGREVSLSGQARSTSDGWSSNDTEYTFNYTAPDPLAASIAILSSKVSDIKDANDNPLTEHTEDVAFGVTENTPPTLTTTNTSVSGGTTDVPLGARVSTNDSDVATWAWEQVNSADVSAAQPVASPVTITNSDTKTASFDAPDVAIDFAYYFKVTATDASGNTASETVTITVTDSTAPTFSVLRLDPSPTAALSVSFSVAFSEDVQNVDHTDFMVVATETASATAIEVNLGSGSGESAYTIKVDGVSGTGSLGLKLATDHNITDLESNPVSSTAVPNELYAIDNEAPDVAVTSLMTNDTRPALTGNVNDATATIEVTVDNQTFDATNNGTTWTLADDILNDLAEGTYDVSVKATDTAGNEGTDRTTDELVIDVSQPTVIIEDHTSSTSSGPFTVTVKFSEPVDDFDEASDLTVDNGTAARPVAVSPDDGRTYEVEITPTADGEVVVTVNAGAATDGVNGNAISNAYVIDYGGSAPFFTVLPTDLPEEAVTENAAPVVNITTNGPKKGGETGELDGSTSSDTGSGIASYFWEQVDGLDLDGTPSIDTTVTLNDSSIADPTFIVPDAASNTSLFFKLTVTDSEDNAASKWIEYAVTENTPPVVDITNDGPKKGGETGQVYGSSSSDPGGTIASYLWEQVDGDNSNTPASINVVRLSEETAADPTFTVPDAASNTSLFFKLTVTDTADNAASAWTEYVVTENTAPTVAILDAPETIGDLTPFAIRVVFSEVVTGFDLADLTVGNGSASGLTTSDNTTYSATITPDGSGNITLDVLAGVAQDLAGNGNIAAAQVVVENKIVEITKRVISNFMFNRGKVILGNQPNISGFLRGTHANGGGSLGKLSLKGNENGMDLAFASSLSKIDRERQKAIEQRVAEAHQFDGSANDATPLGVYGADIIPSGVEGAAIIAPKDDDLNPYGTVPTRRYDIWTEVYGATSTSGDNESSYWIGYLGGHYFVSENLIIGGLVQLDWADEEDSTAGSAVDGFGWMVGPYLVGRIPDSTLSWDLRAAWGRSNNTVNPIGVYTDDFETERWLVSGTLEGSYNFNDLIITPTLQASWFEETQQTYIDSLGNEISAQTISLGELKFGPEFSTNQTMENGMVFAPSVGIAGVWNFGVDEGAASPATVSGDDEIRARVDLGIDLKDPKGRSLALSGYYDGLGVEDYEAMGGELRLSMPFQ